MGLGSAQGFDVSSCLSVTVDVFIRELHLGTLITLCMSLKSGGFSRGFPDPDVPNLSRESGDPHYLRSLDLTQGFLPRAKDGLFVKMGRGNGRFIPLLGFGKSQALVGRR